MHGRYRARAAVFLLVIAAGLLPACKGRAPDGPGDGGDGGLRARDVVSRDLNGDLAFPPGSPCGAAGARCCPGNLCGGGGCCVENRCLAAGTACAPLDGMCANGSCGSCGGVDQPCCGPTGACTAIGSRCIGGTCAACGSLGEDCCPQNSCLAPGSTCSLSLAGTSLIGVCIPCGEPGLRCCAGSCAGEACCASGDRCVAAGASCGGRDGTCGAGRRCNGCGEEGQPCCGGSGCNGIRLGCDPASGTCTAACGGPGQPCCRGMPCSDTVNTTCAADPALPPGAPAPRTCRPCGGPGEPCCAVLTGSGCREGGCCVNSLCQPAGSMCQVGLGMYGVCEAGLCTGCGVMGMPCCPMGGVRGQPACPGEDFHCQVMTPPEPPPPQPPPQPQPPSPSMCLACGGPAQPCCAFNRCAGGGCCARVAPGEHGVCVSEGEACGSGGLCMAGGCGNCGRPGQRCCGTTCSAPFTTCRVVAGRGEQCLACGTRGAPCCFDQASGANCAQNLYCRSGQCLER